MQHDFKMLSTLNTVGAANDKRHQNSANFNDNTLESCSESGALQGLCALIKSPTIEKDLQRYSSSDSEGLQVHFNVAENNKESTKKEKSCGKGYENIQKESTSTVYLPDLCNQFEEMSKVSFQPPNNPTLHQQGQLTRDSKNLADLSLSASPENLFDENFDLDDFMFPQNAGSTPQLSSGAETIYNSANGTEERKEENGIPFHMLPTNSGLKGFCQTNFNSHIGSTKTLPDELVNSNILRHCSYSHACNNAFETFDSPSCSSPYLCNDNLPEQQIYANPNFYGKRMFNELSTSIVPENSVPNSHPFHTPHQQKLDSRGSYIHTKPCLVLDAYEGNNNSPQFCPVTNGVFKNGQMGRMPNESSDSRGESNVTDITDQLDSRMEPMMRVGGIDKITSSKKTAYNEKWGVKVFKAWCIDRQISEEFEKLTAEELNELLIKFWKSIRKTNGDYYGRNSLFNLRAMINKHLKGDPFSAPFDIVTDDRFRPSNECLDEQLKHLKGLGRTIAHKVPISPSDFKKLYDSKVLSTSTPVALLRKVWFEITLHFCPKGGEAQEKITKDTFKIYRDECGRRYVARAAAKPEEEAKPEARMYDTFTTLCPVRSFEFYLSKLHPMQSRLFQQPRKKANLNSTTWYGKSPIGEKALQQMMSIISREANLSKRYTNHCVRTTALQQFTELRKNYEILESPRPGSVSSVEPILEDGQDNLGMCLKKPIEESILEQNGFREMTEAMTSSPGLNLYNPIIGEVPSTGNYMIPYNHVTDTTPRRHTEPNTPMENLVPLSENPLNTGLAKREYFSEVPLFPPPPYSEPSMQSIHPLPLKRPRTEEGFYQVRPQSAPIEPIRTMINPSPQFDVGDSGQCPSYTSQSCGPHSFSNGEIFKDLSLPVLSPTTPPLLQLSAFHNKKRLRKMPTRKSNKMSETIVPGFSFELAEPCMDFEKPCVESQAQA